MVTAPSRADEPKISAGEMEQIEDFFAQLEAADAQSETETSQLATDVDANQDTEEDYTPDSSATFESTEQSAEDVMGAYVEALKNLDSKAILSLMPATVSGEFRDLWVDFDSNPTTALRKVLQEAFGQAEIVSSKHVGSEFHFPSQSVVTNRAGSGGSGEGGVTGRCPGRVPTTRNAEVSGDTQERRPST